MSEPPAGASRGIIAQDSITVVITDSGLGGLAVVAQLEAELRLARPYASVRLIFCNALADLDYQYNQMADTDEKARIFDAALRGMTARYDPPIILIACNTLSAVFPRTRFARESDVPVVGIVGYGIDLMYEHLRVDSLGTGIILGTATTISQNSHRDSLVKLGIAGERIAVQACAMLEGEIQLAPESDVVRSMIEMYAMEALDIRRLCPKGASTSGFVVFTTATFGTFSRKCLRN